MIVLILSTISPSKLGASTRFLLRDPPTVWRLRNHTLDTGTMVPCGGTRIPQMSDLCCYLRLAYCYELQIFQDPSLLGLSLHAFFPHRYAWAWRFDQGNRSIRRGSRMNFGNTGCPFGQGEVTLAVLDRDQGARLILERPRWPAREFTGASARRPRIAHAQESGIPSRISQASLQPPDPPSTPPVRTPIGRALQDIRAGLRRPRGSPLKPPLCPYRRPRNTWLGQR